MLTYYRKAATVVHLKDAKYNIDVSGQLVRVRASGKHPMRNSTNTILLHVHFGAKADVVFERASLFSREYVLLLQATWHKLPLVKQVQ